MRIIFTIFLIILIFIFLISCEHKQNCQSNGSISTSKKTKIIELIKTELTNENLFEYDRCLLENYINNELELDYFDSYSNGIFFKYICCHYTGIRITIIFNSSTGKLDCFFWESDYDISNIKEIKERILEFSNNYESKKLSELLTCELNRNGSNAIIKHANQLIFNIYEDYDEYGFKNYFTKHCLWNEFYEELNKKGTDSLLIDEISNKCFNASRDESLITIYKYGSIGYMIWKFSVDQNKFIVDQFFVITSDYIFIQRGTDVSPYSRYPECLPPPSE